MVSGMPFVRIGCHRVHSQLRELAACLEIVENRALPVVKGIAKVLKVHAVIPCTRVRVTTTRVTRYLASSAYSSQNGIRNMGYVLKCKQFFERVVGKELYSFQTEVHVREG